MKRLLFISILMLLASLSFSQESTEPAEKKLFFKQFGYTCLLDFYQLPVEQHIYTPIGTSNATPDTIYARGFGFSLGAFQFTLRRNLFEINENSAIGLTATPSIGFGLGGTEDGIGIGTFNLPLFVSYESGAGSTFSTVKNNGFFFGLGYEIAKAPLVWLDTHSFPDDVSYKSVYGEPVCSFGFRYWRTPKNPELNTQGEKLAVLGIKFGMGSAKPYYQSQKGMTESRSFSVRAYYSVFFDY